MDLSSFSYGNAVSVVLLLSENCCEVNALEVSMKTEEQRHSEQNNWSSLISIECMLVSVAFCLK